MTTQLSSATDPGQRLVAALAGRDFARLAGLLSADVRMRALIPPGLLELSGAEAATRIADRPDPVPNDVWKEAARHYDEAQLAALVVAIAAINAFNRVNAATRQVTGDWVSRYVGHRAEQAA